MIKDIKCLRPTMFSLVYRKWKLLISSIIFAKNRQLCLFRLKYQILIRQQHDTYIITMYK